MKKNLSSNLFLCSIFFIICAHQVANAQGFGIGQPSPTEILHLTTINPSNTAIRFDCQTTAGTSTASFANAGTAPTNDATVGTVSWNALAGTPTPVPKITTGGAFATAAATTGTTNYIKYTNNIGTNFATIPVGAVIQGIQVTVDRKRVDAANTVSILDAWNKSTNNANSSGFTWSYPVSAGTNRLLVVVIGLFDGGTQTISSVTYGGQAMTSAVSISKNNLLTQIFYLNDAGISAASGTNIISTYSGGAQLSYMSAASFQGVNQTTPTASPKTNSSGANVASLGTSTAVNYAAGDYVIVAAAIGNIGTANEFTETAGYTERSDFFLTNGSPLSAAFSVADEAFAGAGSTTPTFTFATQNNPDVVAAIDIQANNINTVYDNSVRLYKAGSLVGNDKAATATLWPTAAAAVTYGTATDLWGQSWTDADFKNAGFGVGISATGTNSTAEIDQIAITVTYIPSASFSSFDMGIQESNGFFKIAASNALGTTDRLTIDASGKVGIGCSTPQYTLHVIGDIASSATVRTTNAVVTGAITACSDVRYKTNIIPLSNSLTNVLKLQGVSYNWKVKEFPAKNFSQAPQVGFIAQDIEKIYPQLVFTDVDGYKSVDYSKLTPMLVEAIKEQQRTIEELKVKLAETTVKAMKYDALELRLGVVESKMNMLSNNFYGEAKK